MSNTRKTLWLGAACTAIAITAMQPMDAMAQDRDPQGSAPDDGSAEIVVTGTQLRGIAPVGTNVVKLSDEAIAATGATSANQVLARVPQVTSSFNQVPTLDPSNPGLSIVRPNIRNIGAAGGSTTLILMDGHKLVGAGILQTTPDPDIIPPSVLESVEVVPDGGSAVYGADAVGGVINFITRKRFDGIQAGGRYGFADDYHTLDTNLTVGKDWGSGSAYVAYVYAEHGAILGRDRDYVSQVTSNSGFCNPGTVLVGGNTFALPGLTPGTVAQCDKTDLAAIITPREHRHSVFASLSQELSDAITLDVRGFYTQRSSTSFFDPDNDQRTVTIAPTNPYYRQVAGFANQPQSVRFSYKGVIPNDRRNRLEEYGIAPTLTADLGHGWQLRALGNLGWSITSQRNLKVDAAAEAARVAGTTAATALNPYDPGASDPAVLASIFGPDFGRAKQKLANGRVIIDGSPVSLPGGEVKMAIGAEYSHEGYRASLLDLATPAAAKTSRNVKSLFGELAVPIVGADNEMGLINRLIVSASARYDHYSDFGGTFNPKFGITYNPVSWWTIRGNWGKAFNAPSLADTEKGAADTRAILINASPFVAAGDVGNAVIAARPSIIIAGGNANLGPQKAKTWSIGTDISPPVVPGLTLKLTYYNIALKDAIGVVPFFSAAGFSGAYPDFVIRDPAQAISTGRIGSLRLTGDFPSVAALYAAGTPYVLIDARRQNLGLLKQNGLDFGASYVQDTGFGSITANVSGTYTLHRKLAAVQGAAFVDDLKFPGSNRFTMVSTLGAKIGNFFASATWNHSAGYDLNPAVGTQQRVGSFNPVDLYFTYDVKGDGLFQGLQFSVNVNNVFDKDPPFYAASPGFQNGSTLGRLVLLGVNKKF